LQHEENKDLSYTTIINFIYADDAPLLKEATLNFFDDFVETNLVDVYISNVMFKEINDTQNIEKRHKLLAKIGEYQFEVLSDNVESRRLAKIYIEEKIIPAKKVADAEHIGISTVSEMDILLSWNFRHLEITAESKK
jgi:hypothetical protein